MTHGTYHKKISTLIFISPLILYSPGLYLFFFWYIIVNVLFRFAVVMPFQNLKPEERDLSRPIKSQISNG